MARVLIIGCGDVGTSLGKLLVDQHEVWGVRRQAEKLPDSFQKLSHDLRQPFELNMPDPDLIVYCAAAKSFQEADYRAVYYQGLKYVLDALKANGSKASRIIFTSSTGVYHQNNGEVVDEASPTEPTRFSGRILLEAEALLQESGMSHASVRFGGIYGPGRNRLLEAVRTGAAYPSEPVIYSNRIHRDDCAAMLAHLLFLPELEPVYVGTDGSPAPMHEVAAWMRDRFTAYGIPQNPSTPTAIPPRRASKRCQSKLIADTGFQFIYPNYQAGYEPMIRDWAAQMRA